MSDYKSILYEEKGPVRLITLNRPEALNAIGAGRSRMVLVVGVEKMTALSSAPTILSRRTNLA